MLKQVLKRQQAFVEHLKEKQEQQCRPEVIKELNVSIATRVGWFENVEGGGLYCKQNRDGQERAVAAAEDAVLVFRFLYRSIAVERLELDS